jgi:arylsulfatase A
MPRIPHIFSITAFCVISFCRVFAETVAPATPEKPSAAERPNIVIILADDLGYGDLGCFGCKDIPTPNIDRLARSGVRFTQAYAYNVCSPTRAALLTGRYAERSSITTALMGGNFPEFGKAVTVAKVLHESGYTTGLVGKWHLGYTGNVRPTRMGYDEFFGNLGGKLDYFKHTDSTQKNGTPEGRHDLWEGETEVTREGYTTDLFTERARKFIRDHTKGPFYLQIAYNAPHYSTVKGVFQAPAERLKLFGVTGSPDGTRGGYAAMVSCLDDGVGRVLDELKAQNLERKTLVIFLSDNGSELVGSNAPWSGGKHSNKDGGVRVPWIASLPGVIPAGGERKDVVHVTDIMPTLLALAHATPPESIRFDGVDIRPALTGGAAVAERPLFFPPAAVREGRWKLNAGKLYDLENDPAEMHDVSNRNEAVRADLTRKLEAWRESTGQKKKER